MQDQNQQRLNGSLNLKRYQNVFPKVKLLKNVTSNEYWSIDHKFAGIDTTGEEQFTLCAAGLKGSVTLKRSHLVIIDDPVKSAADIGNPDIRKMMQDNWNAVIAPTMFEGARAICLGTDSVMTISMQQLSAPQNNWMQIVLSAILNNEETGEEVILARDVVTRLPKRKETTSTDCFLFSVHESNLRQNELSLHLNYWLKQRLQLNLIVLVLVLTYQQASKKRMTTQLWSWRDALETRFILLITAEFV